MSQTVFDPNIVDAATKLAKQNRETEDTIVGTYLFPSKKEIRLLHEDLDAQPLSEGEAVTPFYFAADPIRGIRYPLALALIRPEDRQDHKPPKGWGEWKKALEIWRLTIPENA